MNQKLDQAKYEVEKMKKEEKYSEECDSFYLSRGSEGYGSSVFEQETGCVTLSVPATQMLELMLCALTEESGRLELITDIEDRLGSPGYPDYFSWESNVKSYRGKAIISLIFKDGKPEFSFDLPEHESHPWSGW